jgi:hypothetical protein
MREAPKELLEPLPDGLMRVSRYDEYLRITKQPDNDENFIAWTRTAYTLMKAPEGAA